MGWSREQVAEKADTSANYIGVLERGDQEAGLRVILRLSKALGVAPGELLDGLEPDVRG